MMISELIGNALKQVLGEVPVINGIRPVSGGSINRTFRVETKGKDHFVKINSALEFPGMMEAEADGLDTLRSAGAIRIPEVAGIAGIDDQSVLVMEYISSGKPGHYFFEDLGSSLAAIHRMNRKGHGYRISNYIGSIPQTNSSHDRWCDFFISERMEPMLDRASKAGLVDKSIRGSFNDLYTRLSSLIPDEPACLLHGDLWSGNFMCDQHGYPVLIDPAVYYGNREMDIAMTRLFGGFDENFYSAYQASYPMRPGWEERCSIHNLYPLLVHLNLFGKAYLADILQTLRRFAG